MTGVRKALTHGAFALAVPCLAAGGAQAQTVGVQSGEHADFTRLVLDIGADRLWSLSGEGDARRLTLDPPVSGFAIDRVFDLIPRTRLAGLSAGDALDLTLGCVCSVSATRYAERYLILDIAEQPEGARAALPAGAPDDSAEAARRRAAAESLPDTLRLLTRPSAVPEAAMALEERGIVPPTRPAPAPEIGPADDPGVGPALPARGDIDLAEAARIMSEQLARAAASGLLEASPGRPLSDADPIPEADEGPDDATAETRAAEAPAAPERGPVAETLLRPGVPIRAETALDVALHRSRAAEPQRNRLVCSGAEIPIRDWSRGAGVQSGLGALRLALYDERDVLQPDAVEALARHYLFYGFGAEAAYWLGQIETAPEDLLVLAALVDGVEGARFLPEPDPLTCSDEELLWRYLDGALGAHPLTEEQVGRLQRAAAALPIPLRDQIAPRVLRLLQADGYPHAARNLRDMLLRGGRLTEAEMVRIDRDLGIARPGDPETGAALARATRDAGGDPVGAMAHALAFDRETGVPASEVRLVAAEALLREVGIGPEAAALWHEVILAHAAAGDLERVVALIASGAALPIDTRDAALTALFAGRHEAGDTAALFVMARLFGADWQAEGSEAGRARVAAIAHLREAGLAEAAEVLRAGQRPLILPARPADPPGDEELLRAAWQGGDWARLSEGAAGPHRNIAQRMVARPEPLPVIPGVEDLPDLPGLADRLADSRALRAEIADLLAGPAPQPAGAGE